MISFSAQVDGGILPGHLVTPNGEGDDSKPSGWVNRKEGCNKGRQMSFFDESTKDGHLGREIANALLCTSGVQW